MYTLDYHGTTLYLSSCNTYGSATANNVAWLCAMDALIYLYAIIENGCL